jgi:hypothetical protein
MSSSVQSPPLSPQIEQDARMELVHRITASQCLRASNRLCEFLLYVTDCAVRNAPEEATEQQIGMHVFGRNAGYNSSEDSIVRTHARLLRQKLQEYFSTEGAAETLTLQIPKGHYLPVFESKSVEPKAGPVDRLDKPTSVISEPLSSPELLPVPSGPAAPSRRISEKRTSRYVGISGGAIFACLILGWAIFRWHPGTQSALDQFWSPVLRDSKQVVIYAGTNPAYAPIWDANRPDISAQHDLVLPALAPGETLTSKEVHAVNYEFTTVGDLLATVYITSLLSTWHVGIDVRTGENIAIGDLRHSPAILIGGANNPWTLSMSKTLPIAYIRNVGIQDESGNHTLWVDSMNADATSGESYAIIARLLNPETGNPLIMIAGLNSLGTRVAGQFITDPVLLKTLISTAPAGWANKNLEVVLRTKVLSRDAGSPTVVAVRSW